MCGIAGLINLGGKLSPREMQKTAGAMEALLKHRGPDDSGVWVDPSGYCALSHRRLSIIDTSSAGRQPMSSSDRRLWISFNGEIYNYLELRPELEERGSRFATQTDTEVLIEALRHYGDEAFPRLDGMYAFALFDQETKELILGRDPFGEKPLYYTIQNGLLAFASELHALSVLPGFDATIDDVAIAEYFAFQYVPAPRTIYRTVQKLPPGHLLRLPFDGEASLRRHFDFHPHTASVSGVSLDELADELEGILLRSITRRMISDVPFGAFLSGGVDSSTVVALMRKVLGHDVQTFSLGSIGSDESEHIFARDMARQIGTEHHELMIEPDIPSLVLTIGKALDEPNADSSCWPTYMLSRFARQRVTVLLSGDGGDEMFGGYGRYFAMLDDEERHRRGEESYRDWRPSSGYFSSRILIFNEPELRALLGTIPEEASERFERYKAGVDAPGLPLLSQLREIDMKTYLPGAVLAKVDRMSMQHALEVRTPFLNIEVARFAEKLAPGHCYAFGQGKLVLKELGSRYIPREWLERKKMGFGVPVHLWKPEVCLRMLRKLSLGRHGMLPEWIGRENIDAFIGRQERAFSAYQVWSLLILEIWLRHHLVAGRGLEENASGLRGLITRGSDALTNLFASRFSLG